MSSQSPLPLVINIPHASTLVPLSTRSQFCIDDNRLWREIVELTDWYTEELFALESIPTIEAPVSRLVLDTERFVDDDLEPMSKVGMGCVYDRCSDGKPLRFPIAKGEKDDLIQQYFYPHHRALENAIDESIVSCGACVLIDAHSYPSSPMTHEDPTLARPDICLGTHADNYSPQLVRRFTEEFQTHGLTVDHNTPYQGVVLPERFVGNKRVIPIMIEIKRSLYLVEPTTCKTYENLENPNKLAKFDALKTVINNIITQVLEEYAQSSIGSTDQSGALI